MAKLNKEQLKKLYDYGGILSPKNWAAAVESWDHSVINTASLPIVKTTYEEVVNLYHNGSLDPNVKYEFDYNYPNIMGSLDVHFKNLRIYLDGKDVKVEYIAPYEAEYEVYDKSFVAKFEFDAIVTEEYAYECKRSISDIYVSTENQGDFDRLFKILDEYPIDYEIVTKIYDEENSHFDANLLIYDAFLNYYDGFYRIFLPNNIVGFNENLYDVYATNSDNIILAAITDVQYSNGIFHNVFIDRHSASYGYLGLLENTCLYNASLDTSIDDTTISDLMSQPSVDIIAFGDLTVLHFLVEEYMYNKPIEDSLLISASRGIYIMNRHNSDW